MLHGQKTDGRKLRISPLFLPQGQQIKCQETCSLLKSHNETHCTNKCARWEHYYIRLGRKAKSRDRNPAFSQINQHRSSQKQMEGLKQIMLPCIMQLSTNLIHWDKSNLSKKQVIPKEQYSCLPVRRACFHTLWLLLMGPGRSIHNF